MFVAYLNPLLVLKHFKFMRTVRFRKGRNIFANTGASRFASTISAKQSQLLDRLRQLDTASLCDAHKSLSGGAAEQTSSEAPTECSNDQSFIVLSSSVVAPRNLNATFLAPGRPSTFAGFAYTVQCPAKNDILPVFEGLSTCPPNHVLLVHTKGSTKAVAGELFATEAYRRNVCAVIVLDGPIRDTGNINRSEMAGKVAPIFSSSVTPYAGTAMSLGEMGVCLSLTLLPSEKGNNDPSSTICISPGSVVVGDSDGIVIASQDTMLSIVGGAEQIVQTENKLLDSMLYENKSLVEMTNLKEHVQNLRECVPSRLEFKTD